MLPSVPVAVATDFVPGDRAVPAGPASIDMLCLAPDAIGNCAAVLERLVTCLNGPGNEQLNGR
jgi:hypothetical protein